MMTERVRAYERTSFLVITSYSIHYTKLYDLGHEPLHVDELARTSGLTPMEVSAILLTLELQGGVEQLPGMRYVRRRPP